MGHYVPELTEQGKESIRNFATVAFDGCSFIFGGKYTAGFRGVRAIRAIRLAQPKTARAAVSGVNVVRPPTNARVTRVYRGTGGNRAVYNARGNQELRAIRRQAFDNMRDSGIRVNGQTYRLSTHAYNSLFKSGRKDIMPADIRAALRTNPLPANPGTIQYINPATGTTVFVNPATGKITGVWPAGFGI